MERQATRLLEPYVHLAAFFLPLVVGILGLVDHGFNPHALYGTCLLAPYPADCLLNESVECQRGGNDTIASIIVVATQAIFGIGGIICTWFVYWTVRQQTHRVNNRFRSSIIMSTSDSTGPTRTSRSTQAMDSVKQKRIRAVGMQAVFYSLAYLNGFVWLVFANVVEGIYNRDLETFQSVLQGHNDEPLLYAAFFLMLFMFPIQGLFNAIIYIRPRLLRWKDSDAERSWWWALRQVLSGSEMPTTRRTAHLRMSALNTASPATTGNTAGTSDPNERVASAEEIDSAQRSGLRSGLMSIPDNSRPFTATEVECLDSTHVEDATEVGCLEPAQVEDESACKRNESEEKAMK